MAVTGERTRTEVKIAFNGPLFVSQTRKGDAVADAGEMVTTIDHSAVTDSSPVSYIYIYI